MTRQERLEEIYNLSRKRVELIHEDAQLRERLTQIDQELYDISERIDDLIAEDMVERRTGE